MIRWSTLLPKSLLLMNGITRVKTTTQQHSMNRTIMRIGEEGNDAGCMWIKRHSVCLFYISTSSPTWRVLTTEEKRRWPTPSTWTYYEHTIRCEDSSAGCHVGSRRRIYQDNILIAGVRSGRSAWMKLRVVVRHCFLSLDCNRNLNLTIMTQSSTNRNNGNMNV